MDEDQPAGIANYKLCTLHVACRNRCLHVLCTFITNLKWKRMKNKLVYNDAPDYCHYFFDLIETDNLLEELQKSYLKTKELFEIIIPGQENHAYLPNKWTVKEVLRHIIDCERVYAYRALRFSRFDNTALAGFDENMYADIIRGNDASIMDLKSEYHNIRMSTKALFKSMSDEMLDFKGTANNVSFSARALGFMTIGHNLHHVNFIRTNYLQDYDANY